MGEKSVVTHSSTVGLTGANAPLNIFEKSNNEMPDTASFPCRGNMTDYAFLRRIRKRNAFRPNFQANNLTHFAWREVSDRSLRPRRRSLCRQAPYG